ncbi:MAG: sugar ABC transporter substrate-binding protein [Roseiflexus sp.]
MLRRIMRCCLTVILLLAVLLAACEPNNAPGTSSTPTNEADSSDVGPLLLWHGWSGSERQVLSRLVEQYNRQQRDGRIVLQSVPLASFAAELRAAVAAGSGPHLVLIPNTWIGPLADAGVLLSLDDLLPSRETDALLPVTLASARLRDADGVERLYGVPIRFDTIALYYNAANLTQPPVDTATMLAVGRGLSDPEAQPPVWGLALNLSYDNTIGYLYAFEGRLFDDNGRVALGREGRTGAEQWLVWLTQLHNDPRILVRSDSSILVDRELKDGRAFMTFDWAHQIGIYRDLWGEQLGLAPLPRLSETGQMPRPYVRTDVLAVNSLVGANEREAAGRFLRFMIGAEAQMMLLQSDIQPALRTLAFDGDSPQIAAARVFRAQAEQGLPMPNANTRAFVEQEIRRMQRQALLGLVTPADAVAEADRRLRERLEPVP